MTPTAYIVTPISTPPEEDGWYMVGFNDSPLFENRQFKDGEWKTRWKDELLTFLKPVDLSKMIQDAFEAGEQRQYERANLIKIKALDKDDYVQSILNPPK